MTTIAAPVPARSGANSPRRRHDGAGWPASLLRGALYSAAQDLQRFELGQHNPLLRRECRSALDAIDEFLPLVRESAPKRLTVGERAIVLDEPAPLGAVLIVTAPECSSTSLLRHVFGALVAGNRVAVSHHRTIHPAARIVLDSLQRFAPPNTLLQFEEEPWSLTWNRVSIAVLTPTRVFLNDEPWISWRFDDGADHSASAVVDFYLRHATTTMTWECCSADPVR